MKHVGATPVGGPFDCIDDHVEKAYCDDAKVKDHHAIKPLNSYNAGVSGNISSCGSFVYV